MLKNKFMLKSLCQPFSVIGNHILPHFLRKKHEEPKVAISQILLNKENEILFGERKDFGTWTTPMGHLKMFERFEDCCSRKLEHYTALKVPANTFKHFRTMQNFHKKLDYHYVTLLYVSQYPEGQEIKNMYPEKYNGWHWKTCEEMYEKAKLQKCDVINSLLDMFNSSLHMQQSLRKCISSGEELKQLDSSQPVHLRPGLELSHVKSNLNPFCKQQQKITVHYIARFEDGEIFDCSKKDQPIQFTLGAHEVIEAWEIAFENLRVGESAEIITSDQWAYGAMGIPGVVPPNSKLVFEVDVLDAN